MHFVVCKHPLLNCLAGLQLGPGSLLTDELLGPVADDVVPQPVWPQQRAVLVVVPVVGLVGSEVGEADRRPVHPVELAC